MPDPMRIAALYDVHGNLPALEAVLRDVEAERVDLIVVGGDVVPGWMPRDCLEALAVLDTPTRYIHGNGEQDVLRLHRTGELPRVPAAFHGVMRWVEAELSSSQLRSMAEWPRSLELDVAGVGRVVACHATPRDDNEIFTRETPAERLRPVFEDADLVLCGHTHMQFDRMIGSVRVVNAGSVGMPFGAPGAYWAVVGRDVELRRTEYDLAAAAERLRRTEYPLPDAYDLTAPPSEEAMLAAFEAVALGGPAGE